MESAYIYLLLMLLLCLDSGVENRPIGEGKIANLGLPLPNVSISVPPLPTLSWFPIPLSLLPNDLGSIPAALEGYISVSPSPVGRTEIWVPKAGLLFPRKVPSGLFRRVLDVTRLVRLVLWLILLAIPIEILEKTWWKVIIELNFMIYCTGLECYTTLKTPFRGPPLSSSPHAPPNMMPEIPCFIVPAPCTPYIFKATIIHQVENMKHKIFKRHLTLYIFIFNKHSILQWE